MSYLPLLGSTSAYSEKPKVDTLKTCEVVLLKRTKRGLDL
jgi:hypothetical protein